MYNDLGIGGRLVAYSLSQLEDVRLYKVRLAPQCLLQQLALCVDDQLAAVLLDGLAQLTVVLQRELRRRRTRQNKDIALVQIVLHAVEQTQEIRIIQLVARLIYLGMAALRINDLRIDTELSRNINKIVVNVRCCQHVLHNAAVCARTEAKRNTAAAQRLDRARHVDALAARFQMTGHRAIELAHLQRVLDPLRTVQCSVKRYRDNHGTPLLK